MTGEKFVSKATRTQLNRPTEEDVELTKKRLEEGYYTIEKIQKRKELARIAEQKATADKLRKEAKEKIREIEDELAVKLELLKVAGSIENIVYYNHSNTVKFNWLDYERQYTEEEISDIKSRLNYGSMPKGIEIQGNN